MCHFFLPKYVCLKLPKSSVSNPSSSACGPALLPGIRPLRWDENTRPETAHIPAGESESGRNHGGWSRPGVQGLAVWPQAESLLHTLSACIDQSQHLHITAAQPLTRWGSFHTCHGCVCVSGSGKPEAAEGEHHQASQREAEARQGTGLVV